MTVEIPESVVREAEIRGIPVETLVMERLDSQPDFALLPGMKPFGLGPKSPFEAAERIRELRRGITLGGEITIKELIEESRP